MGVNAVQNYGNDMTEKAARICRAYLPGAWKKITTSDVEVTRISGGLSNWLYHVKLLKHVNNYAESSPREVMLRLYGQSHGECNIQHLISESVVFALLSERKLGPKLHGVFTGGRIEEYIPARPLKLAEMSDPKLSMWIAEKMAALHSLNLPLSKEPSFIWETTKRWLDEVGDVHALQFDNVRLQTLLKRDLYTELKWLRSYLTKFHSPVVFCHNDMQEGNILIKSQSQPQLQQLQPQQQSHNDDEFVVVADDKPSSSASLIIIDYEYCAYNYRAFEIANHFMEWVFDYKVPDYPYFSVHVDNYPTMQQQRTFVEHYLKSLGSDESADVILEEVKHFTLATHFLWVIWSLINGKSSKITFGYWEFAAERLQMYYTLKSQLLNSSPSSLLMSRIFRPR
ncbi:choline/ethanolamine kinase isoform X2 [Planococcus citri]|uniref:choline/ethanolamine kinase isoform X2 n=1 Tax=Planococcus citri TaxID=170843 RepID=UPI0031F8E9A5